MLESRIRASALVAALVLTACSGGSDIAQGEAIVRGVDPVANRVTLDHGDLPGMMKAMRMDFEVADPKLLDGLAPGDSVDIEVRAEGGDRYVLTRIVERTEQLQTD